MLKWQLIKLKNIFETCRCMYNKNVLKSINLNNKVKK